MKNVLITLILFQLSIFNSFAVPADPRPVIVTQADGTELTILLRGDEHGHVVLTEDGYLLFYNKETRNYEYAATMATAEAPATGSGIVATNIAERTPEAVEFCRGVPLWSPAAAATNKVRVTDFPVTGEQHSLVILAAFSDQAFTTISEDANDFFTAMLNEEGFTYSNGADGSARDFYIASSTGVFTPTFDVIGPVTLSESYSYYGENDSYGNDYRAGEFVVEVCSLADELVDFSQYDTDGDGYVDNVFIYYAGRGEADGGGSATIWPHSGMIEDDWSVEYTTDEGVKIGNYSCSCEARTSTTPAGIGTFVHEFGHVLGLNDHYSTTYGTASYVHPGYWDTMANGSYNNDCHTPPLLSAFERAELGWLDYTDLASPIDSVISLPFLGDSNMAYRIAVDDDEYYVLENRQLKGWDAYLPNHGMLIWHIDYDEEAWKNNTVNNDASHQRVDLVEADGIASTTTYEGDAFPGTSAVTEQALYSWDDVLLETIQGISERQTDTETAVISFILAGSTISLGSPAPLTFTDITDESVTVNWTAVDNATYYLLSVTANGVTAGDYAGTSLQADSMTVSAAGMLSYDIIGLEAETEYLVSITAGIGSVCSDTATAVVMTDKLYFAKRKPQNISFSDITETGFTAAWDAVDDADSYVIGLSLRTIDEEAIYDGYDFASRATGMPSEWYCNSIMWISSSGNYGEAAPALVLNTDGAYLRIAYEDVKLSSLQFWNKSSVSNAGMLYIDICDDGVWASADSIAPTTTDTIRAFNFDLCDSLRIRFARTTGRVYIDDIVVGCHSVNHTPATDYDGLDVGNVQSYTFANLTSGGTYVFTVTALAGEEQSLTSDVMYVTIGTTSLNEELRIKNEEWSAASSYIYNLQGQRMSSILPKGIYIRGGKKYVIK